MKKYEDQYFEGLSKILNEGTICVSGRQSNTDKVVRTKRYLGVTFRVDLNEEFPVLKSKHVAAVSAVREILWIMRKQSNNINDLIPHIWDKWADENGSIGKAYGYQVAKKVKYNGITYDSQVHYVLDVLKNDPSCRRAMINIWNPEELGEINLSPCCFQSQYVIMDGKLNCVLTQRSGDYLVGVPFNTTQYAALTIMFARHLGIKPGTLIHNIADAHIYESQYGNFDTNENTDSFKKLIVHYDRLQNDTSENILFMKLSKPEIVINREDTDFFNIGDYDFKILNNKANVDCFEDLPFEVEA